MKQSTTARFEKFLRHADPQMETITVLRLASDSYIEHGVFARGQRADSVVVPGFSVSVDEVFDVDCPPDDGADE